MYEERPNMHKHTDTCKLRNVFMHTQLFPRCKHSNFGSVRSCVCVQACTYMYDVLVCTYAEHWWYINICSVTLMNTTQALVLNELFLSETVHTPFVH